MLEKQIQKKILDYLKGKKLFYYKIIAANKNGIPDIAIVANGNAIFFEVKRDAKQKLSPIQEFQAKAIQEAGGHFFRVDNLDEVKDILKGFKID